MTCRTRYTALFEDFIKTLAVLGSVYHIRRGTEDTNSHIREVTCELDSCLTTELNYNAVGLFSLDDSLNVLFGEGVEVEAVACVEVGRNGLGVVVADNSLIAELLQSPYAVNGAVVEFDTLTDTYRTGTENNDLFLACISTLDELLSLVLLVKCGVEVRRFSLELAGAGIYFAVSYFSSVSSHSASHFSSSARLRSL